MYDYGDVDNNLIKYRNTTPPTYNLKDISIPIALFSSPSDWLSSASDIQTLLGMLQDGSPRRSRGELARSAGIQRSRDIAYVIAWEAIISIKDGSQRAADSKLLGR
ncbi:hypothetical protein PYW07_000382 [Mythimna separata]|uniref:Uncharacterized protein n=1 Tax=Mythimna separata TaxID=271217 RepID=A0AAD8E0H6_MYTSE|nr:hypothetical protein PYW07_000382 [Mythimna separata]